MSQQFQVYETPETARTDSKRYLHSIKATFSITRQFVYGIDKSLTLQSFELKNGRINVTLDQAKHKFTFLSHVAEQDFVFQSA